MSAISSSEQDVVTMILSGFTSLKKYKPSAEIISEHITGMYNTSRLVEVELYGDTDDGSE